MDSSRASAFSGIVSIGLWVIVYSPQIWLNYREKTGEGLSLAFIAIWLAGTLLSATCRKRCGSSDLLELITCHFQGM